MENFSVSLLTPASDLVGGSNTAEFEAVFGRSGSDTIYAFDPAATYPETNIDFLFGDLFDNSADEFEIIVGISNETRPFGILDKNIPSVGSDRFVLGDESRPFYTASDQSTLFTSNLVGANEFAVIYDFDATDDVIQLHGKSDEYFLFETNDLQVDGLAQPVSGEAIFYNGGIAPDLVGFIVSTPEQDYDIKDKDVFRFVGDKAKKGGDKDIVQLTTPGVDQGQNTTIDDAGNIYVVGSTSGSLGGANQGNGDVWIAKYNNNGNQLWLRQIGSAGSDSAFEVVTDNEGGVYLAGDTSGNLVGSLKSAEQDAWVAKLDAGSGDFIWGQQFNPGVLAGDTANPAFASTAFGLQVQGDRVFVSGLAIKENQNREIFDFSAQDDSWVGTFDKNSGAQGWFTQIRDPEAPFPLSITPFFDESYDLAVDEAGNSYVVGWTQGLSKESDPSRLLLKYDAYLAKVDPTGNVQWVQQFGSVDEGLDFGWAVDTDSQGNVFASGWTNGNLGDKSNADSENFDVWVTKFTPEGTQLVTKQIGSQDDDGAYFSDLTVDAQDNVYLTGYTIGKLGGKGKDSKGASNGDTNAFVAKFDSDLNDQWIQQVGAKEKADYATGVAVDDRGSVIVTGFTEGSLGGKKQAGESIDGWVARLDSEKGKLEKFVGKQKGVDPVVTGRGNIQVTDITGSFVTDERLPGGDNNVSTGLGFFDQGNVASGLGSIFDPDREGSFTDALRTELGNTAPGQALTAAPGSANTVQGSDKSEKVDGTKGNDTIFGGLGSDEIKGDDGDDLLFGVDTSSGFGQGEQDKLKGEKGADTFVLGDANNVFYLGGGNSDYGLVDDFKAKEGDRIRLRGSASDYVLGQDVKGVKDGTAIFYQNDLVGVIKDEEDLSLFDTNTFEFVG